MSQKVIFAIDVKSQRQPLRFKIHLRFSKRFHTMSTLSDHSDENWNGMVTAVAEKSNGAL